MLTSSFAEFAGRADYSLLNTLQPATTSRFTGALPVLRILKSASFV